jgi:hypothetical protein
MRVVSFVKPNNLSIYLKYTPCHHDGLVVCLFETRLIFGAGTP